MTSPLSAQLLHLAEHIERPREDDGTLATLEALLPCEPAIGEVAVACWSDSAGGELLELVRLDSGQRIEDAVALREALTLLAMVETLEELASFDQLDGLARELGEWDPGSTLPERFVDARVAAIAGISALQALAPGDEPRMARPVLLDRIGGALRELERAWEQLEQAAAAWSDAQLEAAPEDGTVASRVQALWRVLGAARRGPLATSPGTALHEGREAGLAMAAAVAGPDATS